MEVGRNAAGTQSLNGGAGDDCIIAGGGTSSTTNTIDGGTGTDICIGAPYTVMTFTNCTYAGTPSTGHAVTFSDWQNVNGTTLDSIPTYTAATSSSTLASMETQSNSGDNLGTRLQAYLTPPISGSYTFWMASDDNGQLFLSTDATAANRDPIASVTSWTNAEAYDTYPSQKSSPITLVAGERYYIEAWSKEATGGDNLSVAWSGPNLTRQVISGDYVSATTAGCSGWCPTSSATPYRALLTSFAGKCADVYGASQTVGASVIQYTCSAAANQVWTFASNGSLQVYGSPKCMAPKGASLTSGTVMISSTCDGSTAQAFTYSSETGLLKDGKLCLEVPGASTADSAQLAINTCNGKPEQNWSWTAGPKYTPDAPAIAAATTSAVTGTTCADCTVTVYRSSGKIGAGGPASTLLGSTTATASGAFSYSVGGALSVGTVVTTTATSPLDVLSSPSQNVATTKS
jgi:hypothetical protein